MKTTLPLSVIYICCTYINTCRTKPNDAGHFDWPITTRKRANHVAGSRWHLFVYYAMRHNLCSPLIFVIKFWGAFCLKGPLTQWEHGLPQPQHSSPQLLEYYILKETTDNSVAPGGAAEPQGQIVQGGGQLPSDRCVGQGRAAGKPGQAPDCWLPDMLVLAAEGLTGVEQECKVLGLLQIDCSWEGNNWNWLWCKQTG